MVDGSDAEQVGQGGTVRPRLGNEDGAQQGGCNGVAQCSVRLAAVCQALDVRAKAELGGQGAEAVLPAELEVTGQAEGIEQRGGANGGVGGGAAAANLRRCCARPGSAC